MFTEKCPLCGTHGKLWNKRPEVWQCPKCCSVFSRFGIVVESENDIEDFWS